MFERISLFVGLRFGVQQAARVNALRASLIRGVGQKEVALRKLGFNSSDRRGEVRLIALYSDESAA